MVEPAERPSAAGQRLSAPDSFGISTLEPGHRPPAQTPPGRQVSIRVQMLDDTQEVFEISPLLFKRRSNANQSLSRDAVMAEILSLQNGNQQRTTLGMMGDGWKGTRAEEKKP
ncbi:hypothetical protein KUCAC02_033571 [Chaenocephalus aceratus]|nr:hypothetical protein KUCAC02_033571 [Chaenocephalus aceratus]